MIILSLAEEVEKHKATISELRKKISSLERCMPSSDVSIKMSWFLLGLNIICPSKI